MTKKANKPTVKWNSEQNLMHIEFDGAIINIHQGLYAIGEMADCTAIEIIADADRFAGERPWYCDTTNPKSAYAKGRTVRILRKQLKEST